MNWMNKQINRLVKGYRRYIVLSKRIDENVKVKSIIKSVFGSLLLTLIIALLPILIIVNMFIYAKLTLFLAIVLLFIIVGAVYVYFQFYYVLLKNYHSKLEEINYRIPQIVESTFVAFIIFILGITLISVIL